MARFQTVGIVSGTSRHPRDVPFMSEFWWGTYSLGTISPQKTHISAKFHVSTSQNYKFECHSPWGDTRIDVLIYSAPQLLECLINLLTYSL